MDTTTITNRNHRPPQVQPSETVRIRTRRAHLRHSLALATGLLAACSLRAEPAPEARRREKVALRHVPWPGIPSSRAAQTAIVEAWNASHPDVQIQEETLPGTGNHYEKLLVQAAAGTLPDLAYMQGTWDYVSFVLKGILAPIDESIKKDRQFNASERLRPISREVVTLLGRTWGLPVEAGAYVIFYNRGMFDAAGVPYPRSGWTWQDLLERARRLTREVAGQQVYGYGQGLDFTRVEPWIMQSGVSYFDRVAFPTKQRFDAPEVIAAVQFVHDLVWKHRVVSAEQAAKQQGQWFWAGRNAFRQEGNWMMPDYATQAQVPWAIAPLPKGRRETTIIALGLHSLVQGSRDPEAGYEFLKFSNKEGQPFMIRHWGRLPVTQNEESKQAYTQYCRSLGVEEWQVAWDAWQIGYTRPLTPAWPDISRDAVNPAINKLFGADGGGVAVEATLRAIAPVVQRHLDQLGQPPQSGR